MSHTATGEWKSFEIRMRRRRAERLVLRAGVAADAGCLDDARAALEEARTLWSAAPGIAEVQQTIDTGSVVPAPAPARAPSKWKEVAAAAGFVLFVCAAIAILGTTTIHRRLSARDTKAIVDIIDAPTPAAPLDAAPQTSPPVDTLLPTDTPPQISATPPTDSQRPIDTTPEIREPVHALPPVPVSEPIRASMPPSTEVAQPEPAAPLPLPAPPPPTAMSTPGVAATTGMSAPVSPSSPIQPPQEVLVRGALARYAKAYSDLDVDAAERVWPSVNRSALARAFGSLESQRVSLGDCRIQVDVATAHASCSGTATWRPKVGGRDRTDERRWDFDLVEKAASGWQIISARAQNR
jgi:hypothetical protein